MRIFRPIIRIIIFLCCASLVSAFAQGIGSDSAYEIVERDRYATLFQMGDTNTPLLVMDWFGGPHVDQFCQVTRSDKVSSARNVINWAMQGGRWGQLDRTNLEQLIETINTLPPPPRTLPPQDRWLAVRGIRANQWFKYIYDRSDVPAMVEKLYEITGAHAPWFIPTAQGHSVARADGGGFICVADDAQVAVSAGENYFQVWDLDKSLPQPTRPLKLISGRPALFEYEHPMAISPDGSTVAVATHYGLYVVDWKSEKLLWQAGALEHEGYLGKHLAIGDNGRTLFAAGAHTIERWNLASGKEHSVLVANEHRGEGIVRFLKTSRGGRVLIAGFGLHLNSRPQSFAVWEQGKTEPALRFVEKEAAAADLSPDGEQIALSAFGRETLVLYKWRTGERQEIRLRNSPGTYSVLWSPDGRRLAAYVDTYPASIYIYDIATWKPIAQWDCGRIGEGSSFVFQTNGMLLQIRGNEINALDVAALKRVAE